MASVKRSGILRARTAYITKKNVYFLTKATHVRVTTLIKKKNENINDKSFNKRRQALHVSQFFLGK